MRPADARGVRRASTERRRVFRIPRRLAPRRAHTASSPTSHQPWLPQRVARHLLGGRGGQRGGDADEARRHLRAQIRLRGKELCEGPRVEDSTLPQHQGAHHRIAGDLVGHRVGRDRLDRLPAGEDRLQERDGDVLAVDAHAVGFAGGEVEPAVGVGVEQVAAAVAAVGEAFGVGGGVVPVAGEASGAGADEFADGCGAVQEAACGVEFGRWAGSPVSRFTIDRVGSPMPTAAPRDWTDCGKVRGATMLMPPSDAP